MKIKSNLVRVFLCLSISTSIFIINESKYMNTKEKEELYRIKVLTQNMLNKKRKEIDLNKLIDSKRLELVKHINSQEYKDKVSRQRILDELSVKTGMNVNDYEEYNLELSFYTDLQEENTPGQQSICANGDVLDSSVIANNVLSIGTDVYIEGFGTKEVKDRGSEKYFGHIEKCDVFIERHSGESDNDYFNRVNNMGRIVKKGYVIKNK